MTTKPELPAHKPTRIITPSYTYWGYKAYDEKLPENPSYVMTIVNDEGTQLERVVYFSGMLALDEQIGVAWWVRKYNMTLTGTIALPVSDGDKLAWHDEALSLTLVIQRTPF